MNTSQAAEQPSPGAAGDEADGAAVEEVQDGQAVEEIAITDAAAPHLTAVQNLYEKAMAGIADLPAPPAPAPDCTDLGPATREIDMSAVKLLTACIRPGLGPAPAWWRPEPESESPRSEAHVPTVLTDPPAAAFPRRRRWSAIRIRLRHSR